MLSRLENWSDSNTANLGKSVTQRHGVPIDAVSSESKGESSK
jgi:hypothetical protein